MERPAPLLVVLVRQVVDPPEHLPRAVGFQVASVLRTQFLESLELRPDTGQAARLEGQYVRPAVVLGDLKGFSADEQGVAGQDDRQLREVLFELGCQAAKGLEFAILLELLRVAARTGVGVLDELGANRDDQAGPSSLASTVMAATVAMRRIRSTTLSWRKNRQ